MKSQKVSGSSVRSVAAAGLSQHRWSWSSEGPLNCPPEKPAREPPRPSRRGPQPWTSVLGKAKAELQLLFPASSGAAPVTDCRRHGLCLWEALAGGSAGALSRWPGSHRPALPLGSAPGSEEGGEAPVSPEAGRVLSPLWT